MFNRSPIPVYVADLSAVRVGKPLMAWPRVRHAAELIKTSPITQIEHTSAGLLVLTEEGRQYIASSKR